jgi:hypothetical protein
MQNKDVTDVHPQCQGCDGTPVSSIKTGNNDDQRLPKIPSFYGTKRSLIQSQQFSFHAIKCVCKMYIHNIKLKPYIWFKVYNIFETFFFETNYKPLIDTYVKK